MFHDHSPHVIVIGASVAGLAASGLFSRHALVTVIENDLVEEGVYNRAGTPQDQHIHVLMEGGKQALEALFPGFENALVRNGALLADRSLDVNWYHHGLWKAKYKDGKKMTLVTRPLVDHTLRQFFGKDVRFMYGQRVKELLWSTNGVAGVKLASGETLLADLVVDATGRNTRAEAWLSVQVPTVITNVHLRYLTMLYEFPEEYEFPSMVTGQFEGRTCGALTQLSYKAVPGGSGRKDRKYAIATLWEYGEHQTPCAIVADFVGFAKRLEMPNIADILANGRSLSDTPKVFAYPHQIRRCWEQVSLPRGFLSVGDACCSFTPAYGQGMTHAAVGILKLAPYASSLVNDKTFDFEIARKVLAGVSLVPFLMNKIEDSRTLGKDGEHIIEKKFLRAVIRAGARNEYVARRIHRVANMEWSVLTMLDPVLLILVFIYGYLK